MPKIRFEFPGDVTATEMDEILAVSTTAVEGIYGAARVAIECSAKFSPDDRTITVDASSSAGQGMARVIAAFADRTIGRGVCRVVRGLDTDSKMV